MKRATKKYAKQLIEKAHEIGVSKQDMQAAVYDMQASEKMFQDMMKHFDKNTGILDVKGFLK